jgi:hypothetical protein
LADEERRDRSTPIEDLYSEYTVYDMHYEKIGKIDDLFVNENDQPEYVEATPKLRSLCVSGPEGAGVQSGQGAQGGRLEETLCLARVPSLHRLRDPKGGSVPYSE